MATHSGIDREQFYEPDECDNPEDLGLGCCINGIEMQNGRIRDFIFTIPSLIAHLSSIVTLTPGDLDFTGTPAGAGLGRSPQVWLKPGDELVTWRRASESCGRDLSPDRVQRQVVRPLAPCELSSMLLLENGVVGRELEGNVVDDQSDSPGGTPRALFT